MYRVFMGAPSRASLLSNHSENATYKRRTVSVTVESLNTSATSGKSEPLLIPPDIYEAASTRISEFYQNTIFHDDEDEPEDHVDQTTMFTWPPTGPEGGAEPKPRENVDVPSFLLHDSATSEYFPTQHQHVPPETQPLESLSLSQPSQSLSYSRSRFNVSHSIAHFPAFHFNPNNLSSLSLLTKTPRKVNLLVAALEVDGPDMITIKNGPDVGKEVAVLRMIVGDEEGRVGKITAWREVAEKWGGMVQGTVRVKRGDVVLIENANGSRDTETSPVLTASPYLGSKLTICYRTLPRENGDARLRPDLRLGASDVAVRKVAGVVRWFENMAGL